MTPLHSILPLFLILPIVGADSSTDSMAIQDSEPTTHVLWPDGILGAPDGEVPPRVVQDRPEGGDRHVRNVHTPTLTVYQPANSSARARPAVIVCPGGGYGVLALDKEGHDIAAWFARSGVVGVVLEYRLPRPEGHVYGHAAPLADAAQSLALVRGNAQAWGVDPSRVGIMGFSAGGHLAASASVQLIENGPNFTVLVYPVVSLLPGIGHDGSRRNLLGSNADQGLIERYSSELHVTEETPPAFLVHTSDDPVRVENSLRYYAALRAKKVPAALHVFASGGHGYAMRRPDLPVGRWPELLLEWMQGGGLLDH